MASPEASASALRQQRNHHPHRRKKRSNNRGIRRRKPVPVVTSLRPAAFSMMRVTAITLTTNPSSSSTESVPRPSTPLPIPNGGSPVASTPGSTAIMMGPPLLNSPELQLRFLNPGDLPEVKRLCREWFPIEYPDAWYTDITSNHKFYSVAAVYRGQIVGLVVAEIKDVDSLPKEDSELLAPTFGRGYQIGYILSLGVVKDFRKQGIASFLLENLIAHLTSPDNQDVMGVYLHVLTTNTPAITFYEHRGFRPHVFLPYYYAIGGRRRDGFTYVLYLNGGHPPWSVMDYFGHCCQICLSALNPWTITKLALRKVNLVWFNAVPRLRQIAHGATAIFS